MSANKPKTILSTFGVDHLSHFHLSNNVLSAIFLLMCDKHNFEKQSQVEKKMWNLWWMLEVGKGLDITTHFVSW